MKRICIVLSLVVLLPTVSAGGPPLDPEFPWTPSGAVESPFDLEDLPQQIPVGKSGLQAVHPVILPQLPDVIPVGFDGVQGLPSGPINPPIGDALVVDDPELPTLPEVPGLPDPGELVPSLGTGELHQTDLQDLVDTVMDLVRSVWPSGGIPGLVNSLINEIFERWQYVYNEVNERVRNLMDQLDTASVDTASDLDRRLCATDEFAGRENRCR